MILIVLGILFAISFYVGATKTQKLESWIAAIPSLLHAKVTASVAANSVPASPPPESPPPSVSAPAAPPPDATPQAPASEPTTPPGPEGGSTGETTLPPAPPANEPQTVPQQPAAAGVDSSLTVDDLAARAIGGTEIQQIYQEKNCDGLWFARNAIYAREGYRFRTARGQAVFGTSGTIDFPNLNDAEKQNVANIQAYERSVGCH